MQFHQLKRREFITLFGGATAAWPFGADAQEGAKIPRIGVVSPGRSEGPDASRATLNSLVIGLRELGYTEGQNIIIERAFGESNPDRLGEIAAELVKRQVDVIVALSTTAARPVKQATNVIPIVAIGMADPVEDELVASLARPGGNVTGTSFLGPELVAKRLQLLSEVVPQHSRVAILWHPRAYGDRLCISVCRRRVCGSGLRPRISAQATEHPQSICQSQNLEDARPG
jgi:putative ABC transport system substrate-binding protein